VTPDQEAYQKGQGDKDRNLVGRDGELMKMRPKLFGGEQFKPNDRYFIGLTPLTTLPLAAAGCRL